MKTFNFQNGIRRALSVAVFAAVSLAAASASAQINVQGDTGIDASGNYQRERAWCLVNTEGEARVDCMKNSGAAQMEKRRGTLDNNGANYTENALQRCNVFMGEDRAACRVRVIGLGGNSGSVQGGGIIKQTETVVAPGQPGTVIVTPKTPNLIVVVPGG